MILYIWSAAFGQRCDIACLACRLRRLLRERESYVTLSWPDLFGDEVQVENPAYLFNHKSVISGIGFFPESVTRDRLFPAKEALFDVLLQKWQNSGFYSNSL